jgi:hypothetical protein
MKIHPSHSKKELCEIVEIFELNVCEYKKINKRDLSKMILYQLSIIDEVKEDNDYYFVKNKKELIEYLTNPDCSKTLTVKEKEKVMELAKYIIMYCKNGFYLSYSPFLDTDDMYSKARHIAQYGDIPSVRRAIDLLNTDPKLNDKIEVLMSSRCKKQLERKKRLKQKFMGGLQVKKGPIKVYFD